MFSMLANRHYNPDLILSYGVPSLSRMSTQIIGVERLALALPPDKQNSRDHKATVFPVK